MQFFRLTAIMVLLLVCVVLGAACAGAKGADGVGIQSIANNTDGTLTIYLTNGQSYTTGDLSGPQGEKGDTGLAGAGIIHTCTTILPSRASPTQCPAT